MPVWTGSNNGWCVSTNSARISSTAEIEELEAALGIPMPEMVFGNNCVEISNEELEFSLKFNAHDALNSVDKSLGGRTKPLQVAQAKEWKASKEKHKKEVPVPNGMLDYDINHIHRPFDWTYTPFYRGTVDLDWVTAENGRGIPYDLLKRKDPILFFDDVQLFEDELGDFGLCTYSVKLRVMPGGLFLLARFYMRVDGVAFRVRDTRFYIDFESKEVIREYVEKEAGYTEVKQRVPIWADDYTQMLRDPNWVDSVIEPALKMVDVCQLV